MPPLFVDGVEIESVFVDGVEQESVFVDGVEVFASAEKISYQMTIGALLTILYGYSSSIAGSVLVPNNHNGLVVFDLAVNNSNVFFYTFNGNVQIPGITQVFVDFVVAGITLTANWTGDNYQASGQGALFSYLQANVSNTILVEVTEL